MSLSPLGKLASVMFRKANVTEWEKLTPETLNGSTDDQEIQEALTADVKAALEISDEDAKNPTKLIDAVKGQSNKINLEFQAAMFAEKERNDVVGKVQAAKSIDKALLIRAINVIKNTNVSELDKKEHGDYSRFLAEIYNVVNDNESDKVSIAQDGGISIGTKTGVDLFGNNSLETLTKKLVEDFKFEDDPPQSNSISKSVSLKDDEDEILLEGPEFNGIKDPGDGKDIRDGIKLIKKDGKLYLKIDKQKVFGDKKEFKEDLDIPGLSQKLNLELKLEPKAESKSGGSWGKWIVTGLGVVGAIASFAMGAKSDNQASGITGIIGGLLLATGLIAWFPGIAKIAGASLAEKEAAPAPAK